VSDSTTSQDAIVIERLFDAPVELIWQMWTQAEHYKQWYGPQGFTVPIAEMELRVGGKRLFCMETPDGSMRMWLTGEYTEIVPNERLVYTESMADEHGNILPRPAGMSAEEYPVRTVITVLLEALDGRTRMRMTHAGVPANDEGASAGWEQAFTKMADHIETVLSGQR
jgi:uncharacterized protein YndB with AHSA1/START domain